MNTLAKINEALAELGRAQPVAMGWAVGEYERYLRVAVEKIREAVATPTALPGAEDALRFEDTPVGKALCDTPVGKALCDRRALAAGDFKDPQHQGQRGCDWDAGFIAACRIVEALQSPRASDEVPGEASGASLHNMQITFASRCPSMRADGRQQERCWRICSRCLSPTQRS
jgi:hypothetical protein